MVNLADAGAGSLRQAVLDANANLGADTIRFAHNVAGPIGLSSGQLNITDNVTVNGPGADRLALNGNDTTRLIHVNAGVHVALDRLTISHGRADNGGGVWNDHGILMLDRIVVSDSQAVGATGAGASGGGVFNDGGAHRPVQHLHRKLGGGRQPRRHFNRSQRRAIANANARRSR